MSVSITGPLKKKNESRKTNKLSKTAIICMKEALTEIEQKNGFAPGDLNIQLDCIIKSQFTTDSEKPLCEYFTKNGSPCRRTAMKESHFCSVHKHNASKYRALETLFREKFKKESEMECDSLSLRDLVLQSTSQTQSSA